MPWKVEQTNDLHHIFDVMFDPSVMPGISGEKLPSIDQLVTAVTAKNIYWYRCGSGGLVSFFPNSEGQLNIHIAFKSGSRGPQARKATVEACKKMFEKLGWLNWIGAQFPGKRWDVFKFLKKCGFTIDFGKKFFVGYLERKSLWAH